MGLRNWLLGRDRKKIKRLEERLSKLETDKYFDQNNPPADKNIKLEKGTVIFPKVLLGNNVSIGAYSYVCAESIIDESVSIGKYTSIARYSVISPRTHPTNWLSSHPFQYGEKHETVKPTFIGNDVWIGVRVTIMGGVKIGDGVIIGSGAVVTKDIPPYAIVVGVPAKVIKYRFSEDIIKQLLKLKWWDLDIETLHKHNVEFSNIEKAIEQIQQIHRNQPE